MGISPILETGVDGSNLLQRYPPKPLHCWVESVVTRARLDCRLTGNSFLNIIMGISFTGLLVDELVTVRDSACLSLDIILLIVVAPVRKPIIKLRFPSCFLNSIVISNF